MNLFILNSAVLLYFYIVLVVKIIAVTVPLDQVVQVKGIKKHAQKSKIDPLIQDKWKNSIDVTQNENSLSKVKKRKDEPVNLEFFKSRYDLDDGTSNIKKANIFKDKYMLQKNFLQKKDLNDIYEDYYALQLHEKNFRWSLVVEMGSTKKPIKLVISTNTPYTVMYCSYGPPGTGSENSLKYDITSSEKLFFHSCTSKKCDDIKKSNHCLSLEANLENLRKFKIKKKNCTNRFCDYVKSMTFLNMFGPFDDKQLDTCGFTMNIGNQQVKGFFFQDDYYIKGKIKNWYPYFGCITSNEDLQLSDDTSGVAGFRGYDEETNKYYPALQEFYSVQAKSLINLYGLCFKEGGGFLSVGGIHKESLEELPVEQRVAIFPSKHIYQILWIYYDIKHIFYELMVEKIELKNKDNTVLITNEFKKKMIVDSYQYNILLPAELSSQIKTKIFDQCKLDTTNECDKIVTEGTFKLTKGNVKEYPKIELKFEEGIVGIQPEDYIVKTEPGYYRVLIGSAGVPQLGIPFFLNKYLIFDNRLRRIGVSKSDCSLVVDNNDYSGILDIYDEMTAALDDTEKPEPGFFERHQAFFIGAGVFLSIASVIFVVMFCII